MDALRVSEPEGAPRRGLRDVEPGGGMLGLGSQLEPASAPENGALGGPLWESVLRTPSRGALGEKASFRALTQLMTLPATVITLCLFPLVSMPYLSRHWKGQK